MKDLIDVFKTVAGILIAVFAIPAILGGGGAALMGDVQTDFTSHGTTITDIQAPVMQQQPMLQPAQVQQPAPAGQSGSVRALDSGQLPYAPLVNEADRAAAQGLYGKDCPGYDADRAAGPAACFPPGFLAWSLAQQNEWIEAQRR